MGGPTPPAEPIGDVVDSLTILPANDTDEKGLEVGIFPKYFYCRLDTSNIFSNSSK